MNVVCICIIETQLTYKAAQPIKDYLLDSIFIGSYIYMCVNGTQRKLETGVLTTYMFSTQFFDLRGQG